MYSLKTWSYKLNFCDFWSGQREPPQALAIGSFAPVAAFPVSDYQMQAGLNDIAAGVRIGKLLEKAKKNFQKGNLKGLIENMFDLKTEAESLTGQKIDRLPLRRLKPKFFC
jgi:hypothetical protein